MNYPFKCKKCYFNFEIVVSISDIATIKTFCPECHSDDVRRIYTIPHFQFNGKGWYTTDNKKKDKNE